MCGETLSLPFLTPFGPVNPLRSDAREFNRRARWLFTLGNRGRAMGLWRPGGGRTGGKLYLQRSGPNGLFLALGRRGRGYLQEESSMA